jgi:hypothetical protein
MYISSALGTAPDFAFKRLLHLAHISASLRHVHACMNLESLGIAVILC